MKVDLISFKSGRKAPFWHPINRPYILRAIKEVYKLDFNTYTGALYQIFCKEDLFEEGFIPDKNDIVVDIGASIGEYSLYAANKCKKVYAFEPNELNFKKLIDNIRRNNIKNVKSYMIAVGECNSKKTMNLVLGSPMSGTLDSEVASIKKQKLNKRGTTNCEVKTKDILVEVISIDTFFNKIHNSTSLFDSDKIKETPTFFNIDVEGFELDVLKGMIRILRENNCRLIIEIHKEHEMSKIINFLEDLDYECIKTKICGTNFRNTKMNTYYGFFRRRLQ